MVRLVGPRPFGADSAKVVPEPDIKARLLAICCAFYLAFYDVLAICCAFYFAIYGVLAICCTFYLAFYGVLAICCAFYRAFRSVLAICCAFYLAFRGVLARTSSISRGGPGLSMQGQGPGQSLSNLI